MKSELIEGKKEMSKVGKSRFARRASESSVVLALPQPGGADILRAKKNLKIK